MEAKTSVPRVAPPTFMLEKAPVFVVVLPIGGGAANSEVMPVPVRVPFRTGDVSVNPAIVVAVPPRGILVDPTVKLEFDSAAFPILVIVFDSPLIVLLVTVWISNVPSKLPLAGKLCPTPAI